MTTAASLPLTRPTQDTYGPDLVNDRPVTRRDRELDATYWNKIKADVAAACQAVPLATISIINAGAASVASQTPAALGTVYATRLATGRVKVSMPAGVIPACAIPSPIGAWFGTAQVESISGQDIIVRTATSAALVDSDFSLVVW